MLIESHLSKNNYNKIHYKIPYKIPSSTRRYSQYRPFGSCNAWQKHVHIHSQNVKEYSDSHKSIIHNNPFKGIGVKDMLVFFCFCCVVCCVCCLFVSPFFIIILYRCDCTCPSTPPHFVCILWCSYWYVLFLCIIICETYRLVKRNVVCLDGSVSTESFYILVWGTGAWSMHRPSCCIGETRGACWTN